jgi:hypothetical protein
MENLILDDDHKVLFLLMAEHILILYIFNIHKSQLRLLHQEDLIAMKLDSMIL